MQSPEGCMQTKVIAVGLIDKNINEEIFQQLKSCTYIYNYNTNL